VRAVQNHALLVREVDSTRIELRHISEALMTINAKLDRLVRTR
jgi:hypothetical protein